MAHIDPVRLIISGKAKLVGVIGYPVEHTMSPPMHNAAFSELGMDAVYVPMAAAPDSLNTAVAGLVAAGFVGVNVTIPHKVAALELADEVSESASMVGAVNTLHFVDGQIKGFNTDGPGFLNSLSLAEVEPSEATVTVLGSGGAARSIILHLAAAGAARINVVNRTVEKAVHLADLVNKRFNGSNGGVVKAYPWSESELKRCLAQSQLLVNTTPVGMSSYMPDASPVNEDWLHPDLVVYDTVYNPLETKLLQQARRRGCRVISGAEMLVMQGAESFRIWFNRKPPVDVMRKALLRCLT